MEKISESISLMQLSIGFIAWAAVAGYRGRGQISRIDALEKYIEQDVKEKAAINLRLVKLEHSMIRIEESAANVSNAVKQMEITVSNHSGNTAKTLASMNDNNQMIIEKMSNIYQAALSAIKAN